MAAMTKTERRQIGPAARRIAKWVGEYERNPERHYLVTTDADVWDRICEFAIESIPESLERKAERDMWANEVKMDWYNEVSEMAWGIMRPGHPIP